MISNSATVVKAVVFGQEGQNYYSEVKVTVSPAKARLTILSKYAQLLYLSIIDKQLLKAAETE